MNPNDMGPNVRYLTDATFDLEIQGASTPVLVDFWATWCGACRAISPVLDQVAAEEAGRLTIAYLDVEEYPATADRFGVAGLPTLILFKAGHPIERLVGLQTKARLLASLRPHLDSTVGRTPQPIAQK